DFPCLRNVSLAPRTIAVPLLSEAAPVVRRCRIIIIEADRGVVVLDRRIVVPIFKMSFATILEEINFFRIEGDRLVIDIDRPIPVVPSEIGAAAFKKVSLALCIITDGRTTYRFSHELRGRN